MGEGKVMAAFTDVTVQGTDFLSKSVLNELIESFNARLPEWGAGAGGAGLSTKLAIWADGDDIQFQSNASVSNSFEGLQARIENQVTNDTGAYGDDAPGKKIFQMRWIVPAARAIADIVPTYQLDAFDMTWLEFCAEVPGLSNYGWRRASDWDPSVDDWTDLDDPMWARAGNGHGRIQTGDILGPWIVNDMQHAFDAMTVRAISTTGKGHRRSATANTYSAAVTAWASASDIAEDGGLYAMHRYTSWLPNRHRLSRAKKQFSVWQKVDASDLTAAPAKAIAECAEDGLTLAIYVRSQVVGANGEWDANGDPVTEDQTVSVFSGGLDGLNVPVSDVIGTTATAPNELVNTANLMRGYDGNDGGGNLVVLGVATLTGVPYETAP